MKFQPGILCVILTLLSLNLPAQTTSDLDVLIRKMAESYITVEQTDPQVTERIRYIVRNNDGTDIVNRELPEGANDSLTTVYLSAFQPQDSLWPDLDYQSQQRGSWPPALHVQRISTIARSYKTPDSPYYNKQEVSAVMHQAMNKWFDMGLVCPNWWYNEIGGPRILGPALIMLYDELTDAERLKAIKYMGQAKIGMTGQNKTWLAANVLFRGLLERDEQVVKTARNAIVEEIVIAPKGEEGIQPDGSFHQHGPQQQFGNYGLAYMTGLTWWGKIFHGTQFALSEEEVRILRMYVIDGLSKVVWKGMMDVNSCGRQLFPYVPEGKALAFGKVLLDMAKLDPQYAAVYGNLYDQLIKGEDVANPNSGFSHFYTSDMSVYRRPEWYGSLRMSSPRVIGAEIVNGENLLSYQMADGALYVYKTGREYEDIFGTLDYTQIPGITTNVPYDTCAPFRNGTAKYFWGENTYVGGVTLERTGGVSAMTLERNGLSAHKAWFFGEDYIVCRGMDINSPAVTGRPVRTTVAQELFGGEVSVRRPNGTVFETITGAGTWTFTRGQGPLWVLHNGVGYWFPDGENLTVNVEDVTGNWARFATQYEGTPDVTQRIFSLVLSHGYEPTGENYNYVIVPLAESLNYQEWAAGNAPVRFIHNPEDKKDILAVEWPELGRKDVVFYEAGSKHFPDGTVVKSNAPAILSLEGVQIVSLAEPTQTLESITITVSKDGYSHTVIIDTKETTGKTIRQRIR